MTKEIVAKEVALVEFDRFADCMDLDVDTSKLDVEDKVAFEDQKGRIVKAIMCGSLTINGSGEPEFTPQRSKDAKPIKFPEPTGSALMAMDKRKKNEDMAKFFATMGDMTGEHPSTFAKMKMADLKVCMAIAILFLG